MSGVEYPDMRAEVIGAVQVLADPEYQRRVWVRREFPQPDFYDDFSQRINILDDLKMREDPSGAVGDVLRDENEVRAIVPLNEALGTLFDRHGHDLTDEEYLATPEWGEVVAAARAALRVLTG